ncbi:DUF4232 domain-containing protein [Streptomyces litchfieldiae]|uniref:DUF4232 domain-containing protein n=1 Tax=Streptomyces litchfieldiae TaxID=3075543 RepID=A0ABU2MJ28_9ACTN|nr:DUF4232 domain-containing protein [Streptomyces sp. DSM 44938]MDT0341530.1 DUF4232 domain-containing protein [Streptomyces sp. DSM 44938]
MTSPTDPRDPFDREPSELVEAFRRPATQLAPPPGTFATLRRRAAARRRRRILTVGGAVTACLAGTSAVLALVLPGDDNGAATTPLATRDGATTAPERNPGPTAPAPAEPPTEAVTESPEAGPSTCASVELALALRGAGAAAGSAMFTLEFTNTADRTCTLTGYPGVSLVTGDEGTQAGAPATRGEERGTAATVALAPGERAVADLRVSRAENYPAEDCAPVETRGLRVYPPDERDALFAPYDGLTGCGNEDITLLSVTVVYPAPPAGG